MVVNNAKKKKLKVLIKVLICGNTGVCGCLLSAFVYVRIHECHKTTDTFFVRAYALLLRILATINSSGAGKTSVVNRAIWDLEPHRDDDAQNLQGFSIL